jgi:tripartite-type tricarboxylate transporter receptor subunit TctC
LGLTNTAVLINPHLRKQNYDPLTSFEPICKLATAPTFITVNSTSPYRTLPDFVEAARAKPGALTMASFTASGVHIAFEMFKRRANVDITFVPYAGGAPAVTALLGWHVTAMADNYAVLAEHVNASRPRLLATFSPTRVEGLTHTRSFASAVGSRQAALPTTRGRTPSRTGCCCRHSAWRPSSGSPA